MFQMALCIGFYFFLHAVHYLESESVNLFFERIFSMKVYQGFADKEIQAFSKNRGFKVKFYYKILRRGDETYFPWKSVWHVHCAPDVSFFAWLAENGENLTTGNLRK